VFVHGGLWCCLLGPLVTFSVLIMLKLDGMSISLVLVLIPLWFMNAISCFVAVGVSVSDSPVAMIGWCCTVGLWFAFELMFTFFVDHRESSGLSYAKVFGPLFAIEGTLLAAAIGYVYNVFQEH